MKCEVCNLRDAVIHVKQMKDEDDINLHLCQICASERGIPAEDSDGGLSINHLLAGLVEEDSLDHKRTKTKKCPLCGLTLERFQKKPSAGCHECYTVFAQQIKRIISRRYGHVQHRGRLPRRLVAYKSFLYDMAHLKRELKTAVREEKYEKAAELRDRIKAIQSNPGNPE